MVKGMSLKNAAKLNSVHPGFIVLGLSLFTILGIGLMYLQNQTTITNAEQGTTTKKIIGYIAPWDKTRAMQSVQNNYDVISEVSPVAYTLTPQGDVILDPAGGADLVDDATIADLRAKNIKIIPAIHNVVNGQWNGGNIVSTLIKDSTTRTTHINNIVELVVSKNYDGIDIDYENLNANDRANYTAFLTALGDALHEKGKVLTTDVYGKTSEPGTWSGPQAQDWSAIGNAADEVRIMIYDYNPSSIGPIAPYSWASSVLSFAKTKLPTNKIIQGVPLYGYDWTGSGGTPKDYVWSEIMALQQQYNAPLKWNSVDKVPWFTYSTGGKNHTIYFENGQSAAAKFDLTNSENVAGVSFWRLGGEDPAVWTSVRSKFALAVTPTISAPTPTITVSPTSSPIAGQTITPSPTIKMPTTTVTPTPIISGPTISSTTMYSIYADALAKGWINESYYSTVSLINSSPVYQGTRSIAFTATKGWAGLGFGAPVNFTTKGYNFFTFMIRTTKANQNLAVYAEDPSGKLMKAVELSNYGGYPSTTAWKSYSIPLTALGADNRIVGNFTIQNNTASAQPVLYVDQVQLIK
jgi:spore germination protein